MTTASGPKITPGRSNPTTRRDARKRRRRIRLAAVAAAVVLAGAGTGTGLYLSRSTRPAAVQPCAACVSYGVAFDPASSAMRTVEADIAAENRAVVKRDGNRYVTIALLIPLTYSGTSDASLSRMTDQLRGAYLAQAAMFSQGTVGVRLLLANEGTSTEQSAKQTVSQLMAMETAVHLVAVVGLGVSVSNTETVADQLQRDHMPMFGAVMSADEFNGTRYSGLDQMVPDDSAQVAVLKATLPAPSRAVLVYDQQATDIYTGNLKADLSQAFGKSLTDQPQPFTPGPDTNSDFEKIADDACYTGGPPPVVFYAGRVSVLQSLIKQFQSAGNCRDKQITIVTAGDGDGLSPATTKPSADGVRVSVIYSDVFNLSRLDTSFRASYDSQFGPGTPAGEGLADTWTIGTYNAMEAAWAAIERGYQVTMPDLPAKSDVLDKSSLLNGEYAPTGAAGSFSLGADGRLQSPDVPVYEDVKGTRVTLRS
jgi:hypothetical protein